MGTIGSLSARILADTAGIKSGLGLTRNELRITRQAFVDSTSDVDKLNVALSALESARGKGAFADEQQYAAAIAAVRQQLDPAIRAEQQLAQARQQSMEAGKAFAAEWATAEEKRAAKLAEAKTLLDQAAISQETYNRAVRATNGEKFTAMGQQIRSVGIATAAVGTAITAAFGSMATSAVQSAAQYEQTEIAFSTMLGSAERARATLADLTAFAAATPFQMPELESAARQLIAFGDSGTELMDTLRMIGDAASGSNSQFGDLVTIYNQVRGAGKLLTQDFRQLAERGVISAADLAKHFGVAQSEVQGLLSTGQVGFKDLQAILANVTGEGGRFSNMMEKQSQSLAGLGSTLSDNVGLGLRGIGQELLPLVKNLTQFGLDVTQSFSSMDSGSRKLAAGTILVGTALGGVITAAGTAIAVGGQLTVWYGALTTSAIGARVAQMALNTSMAAGFAAAGVAAIAVGYQIGKMVYDLTEAGKTATRVYQDFASAVESLAAMDTTGVDQAGLQDYVQATERQIAKIKEHNAELQAGQGWTNMWQANADLIAANNAQVEQLDKNLGRARRELAQMSGTGQEALPGTAAATAQQQQLRDQAAQTTAAFQQQTSAVDEWYESLQQSLTTMLPSQIPDPMAGLNASGAGMNLLDEFEAFQQQQTTLQSAIDETTKRLQDQARTAGMTAEQLELDRLKNLGATPEQLAGVEALQQRAAALQDVTKEQRTASAAANNWSAATRGSSEALDRIEAYRKSLAGAALPAAGNPGAIAPAGARPPAAGDRPQPAAEDKVEQAQTANALLAQAVKLLTRIARSADKDPITVEQTA